MSSEDLFESRMLLAPVNAQYTEYDALNQLSYARLLDARSKGLPWRSAAREILNLDVEADPDAAERCWRSHYKRALWSISEEGLAAAASACAQGWFAPPDPST